MGEMNKSPVKDLIEALEKDDGYRDTWIANLAIAFQDEFHRSHLHYGVYEISNRAANNFLEMLCNTGKPNDHA